MLVNRPEQPYYTSRGKNQPCSAEDLPERICIKPVDLKPCHNSPSLQISAHDRAPLSRSPPALQPEPRARRAAYRWPGSYLRNPPGWPDGIRSHDRKCTEWASPGAVL